MYLCSYGGLYFWDTIFYKVYPQRIAAKKG